MKTNKGIRLLAMVMAALLLSVPAIAETGAVSDTGAVKDKLLSDFFDYLYAQEKIYSDVLWAEAYLEQYDQARSWDRLQIARAAANTAWRDIAGRELPEPGMSADDYYNLLLIGVDASFMEVSAEEYQSSRTLMQNIVMGMRYHLEDHVFESHGWESSVQHAKLVRECAEDHLRYCANTADWLLLELEDPARAEHFRAFLEENCPAIASRRTSDLADQAALEEATEQVLTRIENMIGSLAELTGQMNANLYLYEDAIASGDVSQGIGETIPIAGLPLTLPYPWWEEKFSAQRITYYWNDAEGSMRLASTGDVLDAAPDGCVMETTGVSREDLESYKDYLESLGIVSLSSKEEDGGLTVYYSLGGSEFAFSWTEEALTLYMFEKPVCFAPVWYIAAQ
ncbi:MAG: hypothetical protein IJI26_00815 [Clostridia bacterium]|nr:hypothetical protein [Clostridia bacterium]